MYSDNPDKEYLNLANEILEDGVEKEDRTGTGIYELFGKQMEFNLQKGFPLLTTKKVPFRIVAEELFWFLSGSTDLKDLLDRDVNIWNKDAYRFYRERGGEISYDKFMEVAREYGFDMGLGYGSQWRYWNLHTDQIDNVIRSIKENPNSRRHVVSAWNPDDLGKMTLPPCHYSFEFNVTNNKLSCKVNMRSNDITLGAPFNIASYALLTHIIAKMTGLGVAKLIVSIGSAHVYSDHVDKLYEQMKREPMNPPQLEVRSVHNKIEDYTLDDLKLTGYNPHEKIKANLSVGL